MLDLSKNSRYLALNPLFGLRDHKDSSANPISCGNTKCTNPFVPLMDPKEADKNRMNNNPILHGTQGTTWFCSRYCKILGDGNDPVRPKMNLSTESDKTNWASKVLQTAKEADRHAKGSHKAIHQDTLMG